ncbi:LysR family transcriptional regulator [Fusobacterium ulcerans]|uniref:Hca operon transcriptional activator n=1 Tax=Fusobacterium ulcerans TaxID=861 RepID=A0AAX2J9T1_9FUSO|nr:LysR family transcriptional regulator [Fusobacterium ulcerans]AVQ28060.1 LysR family transcriptional regulator [Fusobacterium ulcerans]EFS25521.1 hypothetical protein FUAG_01036 [Fusobacterium ulcerans ATCC 49185]SQI99613.1 Hca operon transcriptional activator [Fusobacterium ulcerans]
MSLDEIKTFIVLASCQNFNRTAELVHVVQSTVSLRIKNLENEVGKKLFVRDKKYVSLTPEGKIFLEYAKTMDKLSDNILKEINYLNIYQERVKIGAVQWFYDALIEEYLEKFVENNPEIATEIFISHTEELIPMVNNGIFDITFTTYEITNSRIISKLYKKERVILVGNEKYNLLKGGIELSELRNLSVIFSDVWSGSMVDLSKNIFTQNKVYNIQPNMLATSKKFVLLGKGVTFLPFAMVKNEIKKGTLIEIPILDREEMVTNIFISVRKERFDNKYINSFLKEIKFI